MRNKTITIMFPIILFVIVLAGCQINEPHVPSWDVSLNVPLTKRSYTMLDLLDKSSELKFYTNSNLLYYSQETKLDNILLSDKLKVDGASKNASETIGSITISSDSVQTSIGYDWLGLGSNIPSQIILPALFPKTVTSDFEIAKQFQSAKLEGGVLDLVITNQFPTPVSITISNVVIRNTGTGEVIARDSRSIEIASKSSGTFSSIPVSTNLLVKNQLTFECTISSSGSGTNLITLPPSTVSVKARIRNLSATEATAKIPAQDPVLIENSVIIDEGAAQSTKYSSLKIDTGTLNFSIVNNLDLGATINIQIDNLKDPQGKTFNETRTINRKQTLQIFNNLSLKNYSLVSTTNSPTNTVSYKISFLTEVTQDLRTIKSTDGITGTLNISSLQLKEFNGILKPTNVSAQRSSVSLNANDLKNKLQFNELNLKNPVVQLRLSSSAKFEMKITGYIEATNKLGQKATLELNSNTLNPSIISPSDSIVTINPQSLSDFFKKFSSFPDSLIVFAGGVLNPNYKSISVKNTDVVTGKSRVEFPLEVGIKNAVFKDSVNLDLSNDNRDKIKDINSLTAGIDITNGLAAAIDFNGDLYDEKNQWLTEFPPKSTNPNSVIAIDGAEVNSNGEPTPKTQTVSVSVNKETAEKISRAKYMRVTVKLNTTGAGNSPVKFRTSDVLNFHAFASTNYQVKAKENK